MGSGLNLVNAGQQLMGSSKTSWKFLKPLNHSQKGHALQNNDSWNAIWRTIPKSSFVYLADWSKTKYKMVLKILMFTISKVLVGNKEKVTNFQWICNDLQWCFFFEEYATKRRNLNSSNMHKSLQNLTVICSKIFMKVTMWMYKFGFDESSFRRICLLPSLFHLRMCWLVSGIEQISCRN